MCMGRSIQLDYHMNGYSALLRTGGVSVSKKARLEPSVLVFMGVVAGNLKQRLR